MTQSGNQRGGSRPASTANSTPGWLQVLLGRPTGSRGLPVSANQPSQYPEGVPGRTMPRRGLPADYAKTEAQQFEYERQRGGSYPRNTSRPSPVLSVPPPRPGNQRGGNAVRYGLPRSAKQSSQYPEGVSGRTMPGLPSDYGRTEARYFQGAQQPAAGSPRAAAARRAAAPVYTAPLQSSWTPQVTSGETARREAMVTAMGNAGIPTAGSPRAARYITPPDPPAQERAIAPPDPPREERRIAPPDPPTQAMAAMAGSAAQTAVVTGGGDFATVRAAQRPDIQQWMDAHRDSARGLDGKNIVERFVSQQRPPQGPGAMPLSAQAQQMAVDSFRPGGDAIIVNPQVRGVAFPQEISASAQGAGLDAYINQGPALAGDPARLELAPQLDPGVIRDANLGGNAVLREGRAAQAFGAPPLVNSGEAMNAPGEDFLQRWRTMNTDQALRGFML